MPVVRSKRSGFTLIEMLIVGALIVLFAGLAMFGAQQMYDENRKKAMIDETKQIGTALSMAYQDLGFYPRISTLGLAKNLVRFQMGTAPNVTYYVRPAMDSYGFFGSGLPTAPQSLNPVFTVGKNWRAPYMAISELRAAKPNNRRTGIVQMRLSDREYQTFSKLGGEDITVVDWPTDTWGNPYMFYQITTDRAFVDASNNPKGLRLVKKPSEEGDYFTAVVSYGPNGVPGGGEGGVGGFPGQMLFVKGDLGGGNADYTLKSVNSIYPQAELDPGDKNAMAGLALSIEAWQVTSGNGIGITDDGSDDIFFKF